MRDHANSKTVERPQERCPTVEHEPPADVQVTAVEQYAPGGSEKRFTGLLEGGRYHHSKIKKEARIWPEIVPTAAKGCPYGLYAWMFKMFVDVYYGFILKV